MLTSGVGTTDTVPSGCLVTLRLTFSTIADLSEGVVVPPPLSPCQMSTRGDRDKNPPRAVLQGSEAPKVFSKRPIPLAPFSTHARITGIASMPERSWIHTTIRRRKKHPDNSVVRQSGVSLGASAGVTQRLAPCTGGGANLNSTQQCTMCQPKDTFATTQFNLFQQLIHAVRINVATAHTTPQCNAVLRNWLTDHAVCTGAAKQSDGTNILAVNIMSLLLVEVTQCAPMLGRHMPSHNASLCHCSQYTDPVVHSSATSIYVFPQYDILSLQLVTGYGVCTAAVTVHAPPQYSNISYRQSRTDSS
ncbi:PREDICTED: uncharacterized protein LOC105450358 [Wasmannia auropunctata]|uniref:uncharacterized protein LOC105450358 n=1 Tax=Wasmannia auropunctata TaxID=64793 RepID=UPI0005F09E78|nr:PREDICTED: uncharacterized protein LOC105450358 [Wasmannia auropunctata]